MQQGEEAYQSSGILHWSCRVRWVALWIGLSGALAALHPVLHAAEPASKLTCRILSVEGKVEIALQGAATWSPAAPNQSVTPGDRIRTGLRSRATLEWSDRSLVRIAELTSMEVAPPKADPSKPVLDLKSGRSYFFNREAPGSLEFRTPVASGAIRGTEFHLAVADNGQTDLALVDGEVLLAAGAVELPVQSGELAVVAPNQAPAKKPLLNALNIIQWVLYYPLVVDPKDVTLTQSETAALQKSLDAYRRGDILGALDAYPEGRQPASKGESVIVAAMLLGVGDVTRAESLLGDDAALPAAGLALKELLAAAKNTPPSSLVEPGTASQWLARSYLKQSQHDLESARDAARRATELSPEFGPAWVRLAELEFGFGRTRQARAALDQGLALAPQHAAGHSLKGFILAAQKRYVEARSEFDQAIGLHGGLGEAWLGRGLVRIHEGDRQGGRQDLQVAATLEPQRSLLRSYLGKAFSHAGEVPLAEKELALAKTLDPNDPTPWLYSALVLEDNNRINEAARDLQHSKELNENRSLFRSRLLLDQDQAVRGANLAAIYLDAGMTEVSFREAGRAVNYDYGNGSAHLFLANSYNALRDPKLINLRYESAWFSELMLAHLMSPVDGGTLSENVSQQEYSRLFSRNHLGVFSSTEYFSSGDWVQRGSQYGYFDRTSYALDASYRTENGQRINNDLEQLGLTARVKQQITDKDSVFLQASYYDAESGDVAQYYNQDGSITNVVAPSPSLRVEEVQEPFLLLGYHREWSPGMHTLFLGGRFDDTLQLTDQALNPVDRHVQFPFLRTLVSPISGLTNDVSFRPMPPGYSLGYENELEAYSAELQQIWQTSSQTFLVGARYQAGWSDTEAFQVQPTPGFTNLFTQDFETDLYRVSVYAYEQVQVLDSLRLIAGVSYDRLHYPENASAPPLIGGETAESQISPKAGLIWSPLKNTYVRGAYTRSLGGVFFDNSVRLEPVQVAGFNQAYRSLIPESVVGLVPGTEFETWSAGIDHVFPTGTYLGLTGEILSSEAERTVGLFLNNPPANIPEFTTTVPQSLDFRERSVLFDVNQLLDRDWSLGGRYRISEAVLDQEFGGLAAGEPFPNEDVSAVLNQAYLYLAFHHPSGVFGQFDAVWTQQSNHDYTPDIPGDDFWQFNVTAGYRFLRRRAEAAVGLLNITDEDYRLNPLTLYNELPRERTLAARLTLFF